MASGNGGLDPSHGCASCLLPRDVDHATHLALTAGRDAVSALAGMREAEDGIRDSLTLAVHAITSDLADLRARLGDVLAALARIEARL
jgi:hypothetical protein